MARIAELERHGQNSAASRAAAAFENTLALLQNQRAVIQRNLR
jgi:hypothetical protein